MLFLFLSLLALCARSMELCYGKELTDDFMCMMTGSEPWCSNNPKCTFGEHEPRTIMREKQSACMEKLGKSVKMGCTTHADCGRECGVICHDGQCKGCSNVGGKDECMWMESHGLKCRWSGGNEMGSCRDDATCHGKEPKWHHGCLIRGYDAMMCTENNDICEFGIDPYATQKKDYEFCADDGGFWVKPCDTDEECTQDCSTGQMCLKTTCTGCFDVITEEDCKTLTDNGLKCVWTGFMGEGLCIADESAPPPKEETPAPTSGTVDPTVKPTAMPVLKVTLSPTSGTVDPTVKPTAMPTIVDPTVKPTAMPVLSVTLSPTADKCAGLGEVACEEDIDCKLNIKKMECELAYTPECAAIMVDMQFKCAKMKNEADCLAVVPLPFGGDSLCTWGRNEIDMDAEVVKCMHDNSYEINAKCESDSDCKCGNKCFDMGFSKVCSTCRDMGGQMDCEMLRDSQDIDCKWSGTMDDGVCYQPYPPKDPCSEFATKSVCNAQSTCEFKDDTCISQVADKKVCKKRGKNKSDTLEVRGLDCTALPGCKWSVKTKGKKKKTKAKCKFSKRN